MTEIHEKQEKETWRERTFIQNIIYSVNERWKELFDKYGLEK